jgi:NO-binding membrane sensor protein with MHYT domain
MGSSIWFVHFVAMIAASAPVAIDYIGASMVAPGFGFTGLSVAPV